MSDRITLLYNLAMVEITIVFILIYFFNISFALAYEKEVSCFSLLLKYNIFQHLLYCKWTFV